MTERPRRRDGATARRRRSSCRRPSSPPPGRRATRCSTPAGVSPTGWPRRPAPGCLPARRVRRRRGRRRQPAPAVGPGAAGRRASPTGSTAALAADASRRRGVPGRGRRLRRRRARLRRRRLGRTSWCAAVLGAGYPSPTRMLTHLEQVVERYLVDGRPAPAPGPAGAVPGLRHRGRGGGHGLRVPHAAGEPPRRPGRQDRHRHADLHAVPADPGARGLRLRRRRAGRRRTTRPTASTTRSSTSCSTRRSRCSSSSTRATPTAGPSARRGWPAARPRARRSARTWSIVADTVYATFVDGLPLASSPTSPPRDLPALVLQELRRHRATGSASSPCTTTTCSTSCSPRSPADVRRRPAGPLPVDHVRRRPSCRSSHRLVADSREVALHNIAGLATPDQVQMALFALAYLLPSGRAYVDATRAELARPARRAARPARRPGARRPGQHVLRARRRPAGRHGRSTAPSSPPGCRPHVDPSDVPLRLAREHGVVVLPGQHLRRRQLGRPRLAGLADRRRAGRRRPTPSSPSSPTSPPPPGF